MASLTTLLEHLSKAHVADEKPAAEISNARLYLQSGDLANCETALAEAETLSQQSDVGLHTATEFTSAQVRSWRGLLQMAQFDFCKSAQHFSVATRLTAPEDHEQCWKFAELQLQSLILQDRHFSDLTALDEATKTCTATIVSLHEDGASFWRMHAKTVLGQLLNMIGEHEQQADRFKIASQHLREANAFFQTNDHHTEAFNAQFALANSLAGWGTASDDIATLEESIHNYQTLPSTDVTDKSEHQLFIVNVKLGAAMAKLGAISRNDEVLKAAEETLRSGLRGLQQNPLGRVTALLEGRSNAALARLIVTRSGFNEDSTGTADAIPLFQHALAAMRNGGSSTEIKQIELELLDATETAQRFEADRSDSFALQSQTNSVPQDSNPPIEKEDAKEPANRSDGGYLARLRASLKLPVDDEPAKTEKPKRRFG